MTNAVSRKIRHAVAVAGDELRGVPVQRRVKELEQSEDWSADRLRAHQEEKLRRLLRHAYDHVPLYTRRFDELGATPEDFSTVEKLRTFPKLTKLDLIHNAADLVSVELPYGKVKASTGGSTGHPVVLYIDKNTWSISRASLYFSMKKLGYHFGDPIVTLTGGSLGRARPTLTTRVKNLIRGKWEIPAFDLSQKTIELYAERMLATQPMFLRGYPTSSYKLARLWEKHIGKPIDMRGVFTTGETLHPHHREGIERIFNTRVMDTYGCGEVNGICWERPSDHRYQVIDEHVVLEVDPYEDETTGTVTVTDLDNFAMPLIRYEPGDRIRGLKPGGGAGDGHSSLERVMGRTAEKMVTCKGDIVEPILFPHVFKHVEGVLEFQVRFIKGTHVKIVMVPENGSLPESTFEKLRSLFRENLPEELEFELEVVERIEPYASGKNRFIIVET